MDINSIKAKLAQLNKGGDSVDYSKLFWKPELGESTIRIVPSKDNSEWPFTELKFHYGIGKYPMLALSNFGKQDPVEEFVAKLKKTDDKDNWSLAGKLSPKTRIFAPIIVRGEEELGVRLWGFGITIFKALLALGENDEYGDYTDIVNGTDLIVKKVQGNPYPETTITPKRKSSPLSTDPEQVELWLTEQPNPLDAGKEYSYEFIKEQLRQRINPEETPSDEEASSEEQANIPSKNKEEPEKKQKNFTLDKEISAAKRTLDDQLKDLFSDED